MLAQAFQSPTALGLSDAEFDALVKVLGMLERGELVHVATNDDVCLRVGHQSVPNLFNMNNWRVESNCGTVFCIGGAAEAVGNFRFDGDRIPEALGRLFYPGREVQEVCMDYGHITTAQAAIALRSYLTHGEPRWSEAMALCD